MSWYQPRITFRYSTATGQSNRDIRFYIKPKPEDVSTVSAPSQKRSAKTSGPTKSSRPLKRPQQPRKHNNNNNNTKKQKSNSKDNKLSNTAPTSQRKPVSISKKNFI